MTVRKVLFIGDQWFGSDSRSLSRSLSRKGLVISCIDPGNYFITANSIIGKVISRLSRPLLVKEFNNAILREDLLFEPDVALVFKGWGIWPSTLIELRKRGRKLVQFYPDVSLYSHGGWISDCVPFFDLWITTKTFGVADVRAIAPSMNTLVVNHAFDPEVHRPIEISHRFENLRCDVSFIGTWDFEKEQSLTSLKRSMPEVNLKIWGGYWERATSPILRSSIQNSRVLGDMYAIAIQQSSINLGLLSGKKQGSSSGDQVTARTFQIPGCGGFMLHQRTTESVQLFQENLEAGFFQDDQEMSVKVQYFLSRESERERIRQNGFHRAVKDHSMDSRADIIVDHLQSSKFLTP